MARYIDADKLIDELRDELKRTTEDDYTIGVVVATIELLREYPTADVAEVKHGEWFLLDECSNEGVYCSVCHKKVYRKEYANQKVKSNYCPNCGAIMNEEKI